MKYVKMIGLLAVAAAALMAFAGSASATTLTSPAGTTLGKGAKLTAVNEGHVTLTGPGGIAIECDSHVAGTITNPGSSTQTVEGSIDELSFTNCTDGEVVDVELKGSLIAHTEYGVTDPDKTVTNITNPNSTGNGTITSTGATVRVTNVPIVGECGYTTSATDIGRLTGSKNTGGTATFDISAELKRTKGSFFCGSVGIWEGNYKVTVPDYLDVH